MLCSALREGLDCINADGGEVLPRLDSRHKLVAAAIHQAVLAAHTCTANLDKVGELHHARPASIIYNAHYL